MPSRSASWDSWPKRQGADGRWLCRWCGASLKGKRQTSFCGDVCRNEVEIRCNPAVARYHVAARDKGACALCGLETERLREVLYRIRRRMDEADRYRRPAREASAATVMFWRKAGHALIEQIKARGFNVDKPWFGLDIGALWEADHIVPVVEGGGGCGLDNYRTLCTPCHKTETAKLAARRAEARNPQATLPLAEASA